MGIPVPSAGTVRKATRETRVGEVRVIGGGRRFVLIEVSPRSDLPALSAGLVLRCCAPNGSAVYSGATTATLRISPERRQPFIVADVLEGEPRIGDPVYYSNDHLLGIVPSFPAARPPPEEPPPRPTPPPSLPSTPPFRATATVHPE